MTDPQDVSDALAGIDNDNNTQQPAPASQPAAAPPKDLSVVLNGIDAPPPTQNPGTAGWGEVARQAWQNLLPSGKAAWANTTHMFRHPIDTVNQMGSVLYGVGNQLFNVTDAQSQQDTAAAKALEQHYAALNPFGAQGAAGLKTAIATDPVGTALDLATFADPAIRGISGVVGTGRAADAAGAIMRTGEFTPKAAEAITTAFPDANPAWLDDPAFKTQLSQIAAKKGITPPVVKEALLRSQGLDAPTASVTGNVGAPRDTAIVRDAVDRGQRAIGTAATNIAGDTGPSRSDLGQAFERSLVDSHNNTTSLYNKANSSHIDLPEGFANSLMDHVQAALKADSSTTPDMHDLGRYAATYPRAATAVDQLRNLVAENDQLTNSSQLVAPRTELSNLRFKAGSSSDSHALGTMIDAYDNYVSKGLSALGDEGQQAANDIDASRAAYRQHRANFAPSDRLNPSLAPARNATSALGKLTVNPETDVAEVGDSANTEKANDLLGRAIIKPNLTQPPGSTAVYNHLSNLLDEDGNAALNNHIRQSVLRTNQGVLAASPAQIHSFLDSDLADKVFTPNEQAQIRRMTMAQDLLQTPLAYSSPQKTLVGVVGRSLANMGAITLAQKLHQNPALGALLEPVMEHGVSRVFHANPLNGAPNAPIAGRVLGAVGSGLTGMLPPAEVGRVVQNSEPEQHADGGRIERKAGGKVKVDHTKRAEALVLAAARAKGRHNKTTEPLLAQPDEVITKALAVANRHI